MEAKGLTCCFGKKTKISTSFRFADRADAGLMLAGKLAAYSRRGDAIVFGLLRGGVPVAAAVAGALKLPLDAFVVTKIGTPWERELAMGAVAEGGVQVLDLSLLQLLGISEQEMQEAVVAARNDLESHVGEYRAGRPSLELHGKTAILVDDGIATGCSILAAIAATRRQGAARVVVAVPVAPAAGCSAIRMEADEFVSMAEPVRVPSGLAVVSGFRTSQRRRSAKVAAKGRTFHCSRRLRCRALRLRGGRYEETFLEPWRGDIRGDCSSRAGEPENGCTGLIHDSIGASD